MTDVVKMKIQLGSKGGDVIDVELLGSRGI